MCAFWGGGEGEKFKHPSITYPRMKSRVINLVISAVKALTGDTD